ncbi:hypothetical protein [Sphingomonas sp.]
MSQFLGRIVFEVIGEGIAMCFEPFFKRRRAVSYSSSPEVATKRSRRRRKGQA